MIMTVYVILARIRSQKIRQCKNYCENFFTGSVVTTFIQFWKKSRQKITILQTLSVAIMMEATLKIIFHLMALKIRIVLVYLPLGLTLRLNGDCLGTSARLGFLC